MSPILSSAQQLPSDAAALKQHVLKMVDAWNQQGNFANTQYVSFRYDPDQQDDAIPLTLVVYEDSGWHKEEVMEKLVLAKRIFESQCGISFNPVLILKTENRNGPVIDETRPGRYISEMVLEGSGMLLKPVLYFVKSNNSDSRTNAMAYVRTNPSSAVEARVHNSGFLYRSSSMHPDLHSGDIKPDALGVFEVLTHELGHILMQDEGHSATPGTFMSEDEKRTNVITAAQCKTMKQNIKAIKSQAEQLRASYRSSAK